MASFVSLNIYIDFVSNTITIGLCFENKEIESYKHFPSPVYMYHCILSSRDV